MQRIRTVTRRWLRVAIQQAHRLASNFLRWEQVKKGNAFSYKDKGSMATIGRHKAVVDLPGSLLRLLRLVYLDVHPPDGTGGFPQPLHGLHELDVEPFHPDKAAEADRSTHQTTTVKIRNSECGVRNGKCKGGDQRAEYGRRNLNKE